MKNGLAESLLEPAKPVNLEVVMSVSTTGPHSNGKAPFDWEAWGEKVGKAAETPRAARVGIEAPKSTSNGHAAASPAKQPETWESPVPLSGLPPVPSFPVDVFPCEIVQFVEETAWATDSPPDFVASMMLSFAGGAIGCSRWLAITETHVQPPCLFVAAVGRPGSGKSPAFRSLLKPFLAAEAKYRQEYRDAKKSWQESECEGSAPTLREVLVDDFTIESLAPVLQANPRGIIAAVSELRGLLSGLNQYKDGGKGNDRQALLKFWDCDTIKVHRKNNPNGEPLRISRGFVALVGTIQPGVLSDLSNDQGRRCDDGMLDRFLISYPDLSPWAEETWKDVSNEAAGNWAKAVETLLAEKMVPHEHGLRPYFVKLSKRAREAWTEFTREHAHEMNEADFPEHLIGPWSKLKGYCGRFSLILHCLAEVFNSKLAGDVNEKDVEAAVRLVEYFKGHTRRVLCAMEADHRISQAKHILKWLVRQEGHSFKRRDLYVSVQSESRFPKPESLDPPLKLLTQLHYLRAQDAEPRAGAGRPPSTVYLINPLWERSHNPLNPQNHPSGETSYPEG